MKGPQSWILAAALGCFVAGMTVGFVVPGFVDALTAPGESDPDTLYVRQMARDFGLSAQQERKLAMVVQARRKAVADLVQGAADQLPEAMQNELKKVRRQADERIRYVLSQEQRVRYDQQTAGEPGK